jgi:sulfate permease, SulP family
MKIFSNLKGDLSGAVTAAVLTIPQCIGYGIIVFAPLGVAFAPSGALLGLYTAVFAGFFAAWLGGNPVQITGPKAPETLVLATVVVFLVMNRHLPALPGPLAPRTAVVIGLVSITILIGGIFQLCLGALRLGNLIKYVPYPVVAGFTNGIAFILVEKQLGPLLGLTHGTGFIAVFNHLTNIEPLTVVVGVCTLTAIFLGPRWLKAVPGSITGLATGTVVYYGLGALVGFSSLGPVIGRISTRWPAPEVYVNLLRAENLHYVRTALPYLVIPGLMLGILGSLESLLTCVASDHATGLRHRSNRELMAQGIGNLVSSCFGGIFAAGSVPRTLANFKAGGRTSLAGMMSSVIILLVIVVLGPLVGKIPLAVIAGIIMAVAVTLVDKGTINIIQTLFAQARRHRKISFKRERDLLFDLFISLVVAVITISVNLIVAVGFGIVVASLLFISKMSKSIIRRRYRGDAVHAKKRRLASDNAMLLKEGRKIMVFELHGPLFFGSAESLAAEVEQAWNTADYCILDMKRVNEIDSTGASIVLHMIQNAAKRGKHLLVSYMKDNPGLWKFIGIVDLNRVLQQGKFFPDTDLALEWAEEHLLAQVAPSCNLARVISLEQMEIAQGFTAAELDILRERLKARTYQKGEIIIREGEPTRDLFLLTKGSLTIKAHLPHKHRLRRVFTFDAGVIVGEMALLDAKPRSADVWAEEDSEVLILPYQEFMTLSEAAPEVALKLILHVAQVLSSNLRRNSRELQALEDF